jgi:small subunit ribosomal protein S1
MKKLLAILLLVPALALAQKTPKGVTYDAQILKVSDGDTIVIAAPFLPQPLKPQLAVRIFGVDTPEKGFRAKCESENQRGLAASEFTKKGDKLEVVVLEVDKENRRLSLGHKQLEENPWEVFSTIFTEGSVHQGTVTSFVDKGAIVSLPYGVEGFAPMKHLVKEDKTTAKVEETLDFKVIEFSKENKKIVVSHTKLHDDAVAIAKSDNEDAGDAKASKDAKPKKVANKKVADNSEKSTLGDFDVLANLKSKMEKSEGATKAKAPKAVVEEAPEAPEAPAAEETEAPTKE